MNFYNINCIYHEKKIFLDIRIRFVPYLGRV